jgi:hypothetical protein
VERAQSLQTALPVGVAGKILLCCLAMALIVPLVPGSGPLRLVLEVAVGAVTYGLGAFAFDLLGARSRLAVLSPSWLGRGRSFFDAR